MKLKNLHSIQQQGSKYPNIYKFLENLMASITKNLMYDFYHSNDLHEKSLVTRVTYFYAQFSPFQLCLFFNNLNFYLFSHDGETILFC